MKNSKKYKHQKKKKWDKSREAMASHTPNQTGAFFAFFPENKLFQVNYWPKLPEAKLIKLLLLLIQSQWGDFYMK